MITYVYICSSCKGGDGERTFELGYPDIDTARTAPMPVCPRCGRAEGVSRFFRHRIYAPGKSSLRDHSALARRFVDLDSTRGSGIVSIGIRMDSEEFNEIEEHIREAIEDAGVEVVEMTESSLEEGGDFTEDVLGLKPGSVERSLFDVRHRNMIEELRNGAPVSGFFLPISGEYGN